MPAAKKTATRKPTARAKPGTAGVKRGTVLDGKLAAPGGLTPAQDLFAREYLRDLNATQAYLRTHPGCTAGTARVEGYRLLQTPAVRAEVDRIRKELAETISYDVATMLRREAEIAFADPRELVSHHVDSCRHCHGAGHRYQRTAGEMERDRAAHAAAVQLAKVDPKAKKPGKFDELGGIGFDPRLAPAADCPECFGRGTPKTIIHDTRTLSPAAASLYAGMKETKEGVQVLMHDQATARDRLERHLGAFEKDNRQKNDLAAQLAEFVGGIHQSGAGKLPLATRKPKP